MTKQLGLYIHIPFCERKCKYCDFYSTFPTNELLENYTDSLIREIKKWGGKLNGRPIDTVYFGGGTPSLLGEKLEIVVNEIKSNFSVSENAEITLELNPAGNVEELLKFAKAAGVNRLSIGSQSGDDEELSVLGRTHSSAQTVEAVRIARDLGFSNISLDLMLGLPNSNIQSLEKSLEFITELKPEHISAYILKIEENTAFSKLQNSLNLPNDDDIAEQYLFMCEHLKNKGFEHYEISNFCKKDMESRHNLKYWKGEEYLGLGPSAHSFVDSKRFYYERDLKVFMNGASIVEDGFGGGKEEYIFLRLRLKSGINTQNYRRKFATPLPQAFFKKCSLFKKNGLIDSYKDNIFLTDKGMLLSNSIITELLECIE
ncbi:MAG: radical SAM family heme chaperone HemW [Ruminococcaceae bacterium]|nr:radical SAM family heme chaperone HemW [Oscillospiraceae bacterium]